MGKIAHLKFILDVLSKSVGETNVTFKVTCFQMLINEVSIEIACYPRSTFNWI